MPHDVGANLTVRCQLRRIGAGDGYAHAMWRSVRWPLLVLATTSCAGARPHAAPERWTRAAPSPETQPHTAPCVWLRLLGPHADREREIELELTNCTAEALQVRTWDGGYVANDTDVREAGAWRTPGGGFLFDLDDTPTLLAPGERMTVIATVRVFEPAKVRVRMAVWSTKHHEVPLEVVSEPFDWPPAEESPEAAR